MRSGIKLKPLAVLAAALLVLASCQFILPEPEPPAKPAAAGVLTVCFLDVGQGDCALAELPDGGNMLIDAGNNADADLVCGFLRERGVERVDYLVGTHPHEDHIGGLDAVIDNFDIGEVIMPRATANTKTFRAVIEALKRKDLKIKTAKAGVELFNDGEGLSAELLAPVSDRYQNLNNYSAVIKLTYGKTSFLFTGDAEALSEREMLDAGEDVSAEVLKVGHHGSDLNSTEEFLDAVSPKYAVISCGAGNVYGHPRQATLDKLQARGVEYMRTDTDGTIIMETDGENISVWKQKQSTES
ncbi:MAG: MBL fold metallo-hydrolase [Clostridiales bacterium]|nr:MBL fold metallo-hydrolase [Clostridiales bacterium]